MYCQCFAYGLLCYRFLLHTYIPYHPFTLMVCSIVLLNLPFKSTLCASSWLLMSLIYYILVLVLSSSACYGVLRFIMESGAKGCEVVVSGKLRGQRAKSMKFTDGLMIHSGEPRRHYVDTAVRHVHLRQGEYLPVFPPPFTHTCDFSSSIQHMQLNEGRKFGRFCFIFSRFVFLQGI